MHIFLIILAFTAVGTGYALAVIYFARVLKAKRQQQERYQKMKDHMRRIEICEELHERGRRLVASGNDLDLAKSYDRLKVEMLAKMLN